MALATRSFPSEKRATLSEAKLAYFEGDFERCLAICGDPGAHSITTASEVALLSARAYLRLARPSEAEGVILKTITLHGTSDASATAQMLLGSARINQGDADGGLAILEAAATRSTQAHFAIRSEISFATALGYWAKRDIDAAERHLSRVDCNTDIIHARALELTAWCRLARGEYRRCAEVFIATLLRLDECHAHDRAVNAAAISTLSIVAAELFDYEFAGFAHTRALAMTWTSGLIMQRYLTLLHRALFAELAGNTEEAYAFAIEARVVAPTIPCQASAWAVSSLIARNADELHAAAAYAHRARQLLETLPTRELVGEERLSMLTVAECCAQFDSAAAKRLLSTYRELDPVDKMQAISDNPCLTAEESLVAAVVAEACGDVDVAQHNYRCAFQGFERLGYTRRALVAAFALVRLTNDPSMRNYLNRRLDGTANYITRRLTASMDSASRSPRHPIVQTLPPMQKEVVVLICQGKSNREIAAIRNVGEQTIKNVLSKAIFPAFGVSSRAGLLVECLRPTAHED
jgi:DNA-binding NarL/FixJ family response regulator